MSFPIPWEYKHFKSALKHLFLVYEKPDILGYLIAVCCPKHLKAVVMKVATHPDYRNMGVAYELLRTAIEILKEKEIKEVCLEVEMNRAPAIRLYEKFNFEITGSFSMDYEEESFHTMTLKLTEDNPSKYS